MNTLCNRENPFTVNQLLAQSESGLAGQGEFLDRRERIL